MPGEDIFGIIIMILCSWGCAGLFCGIGIWAARQKKPMYFWAGIPVAPDSITDISAYNRANGKMWIQYSIPFWISGGCSIVGMWDGRFFVASTIVLVAGSIAGSVWLILRYQHISKRFTRS